MDDNRCARPNGAGPNPRPAPDDRDAILFDGACNLCNALVRWAQHRDSKGRFRFAPLESDEAARLLARAGEPRNAAVPDSIVLVKGRRVHFRSGAVLRIATGLGFPWPLLAAGLLAPRPLRDAAYDWVARNRYRWFGGNAPCPLPEPPAPRGEGRSPEASRRPPETRAPDGRRPN